MKNEKRSYPEKSNSLFQELTQLTKTALYRVAQLLGVPNRSQMNKSELVEALSQKQDEIVPVMENVKKSVSDRNVEALKSIPSSASVQNRPAPKAAALTAVPPAGQIAPVKEKPVEAGAATSAMPTPTAKAEIKEPDSVWAGEEGPDLPTGYGVTVLRALPRDPYWAYLYWEISQETRDRIRQEAGEWFFDIAEPLVRVLNESGETVKEIPVLLDANSWYINLTPNGAFHFELGLKDHSGVFRIIVRSNRVTLPPMEPSQVTSEDWAMISEEFQEIMYNAAGMELTTTGSFPSMAPHVLRQRMRVPWVWANQQWPSSEQWVSSQSWPSSHVLPSSHSLTQK
jgi:uncharacterized protein